MSVLIPVSFFSFPSKWNHKKVKSYVINGVITAKILSPAEKDL